MDKRLPLIVIIAVILGLTFDYFFVTKTPGISVLIYMVLVLAGAYCILRAARITQSRAGLFLLPAIAYFATMVAVRASGMLAFFNIVLVLYLSLLAVRVTLNPHRRLAEYRLADYLGGPVKLLPRFIRTALSQYRQAVESFMSKRQKQAYRPLLRGISLSLPFLILFLLLLSSADLVFRQYVTSIFSFTIDFSLVYRIGLVLFVASLLVGLYTLLLTKPSRPDNTAVQPEKSKKQARLGATEVTVMLSSVGALFLVFVIIQLTYFFGGNEQITSAGFTYADYARRGFFELIVVAAFSAGMIWMAKHTVTHETVRQTTRFKWLGGFLIAEVLIILASAHQRLSLYEEAYGFTLLRLLSHLFLIWLAVTLVLLAVYIIRQESEKQFAFRLFINVIAFFALLNMINPHAWIAQQNVNRYKETGTVDLLYLRSLSEDAVPQTARLLESDRLRIRHSAALILANQRDVSKANRHSWPSANVARSQAEATYKQHQQLLDDPRNKEFYREYWESYLR